MNVYPILITVLCSLITIGLTIIISILRTVRKEGADGREKLYNKIDSIMQELALLDKRIVIIETQYKMIRTIKKED